jgi:triosephosphate isomerase
MKPLIVVNFKTYQQGKKAVKLAKKINKLKSKKIIISVQAPDIYEISKVTKKTSGVKIYSEHVDWQKPGRATGFILPETVKSDGAKGTLLNHSEHPISWKILKKTIKRCKKLNLKIIICVSSLKQAKKALKLTPLAIAFEVPELIASGKAISTYQPENVKKFSKIVDRYNKKHKKKILALCGAGISSPEDVKSALKLGCQGVLIASAITKSKYPDKILKKMLNISI